MLRLDDHNLAVQPVKIIFHIRGGFSNDPTIEMIIVRKRVLLATITFRLDVSTINNAECGTEWKK